MPGDDRLLESGDNEEYTPSEPPNPEDVHMPSSEDPDPSSMPMDVSQFFEWLSSAP